MKFQIPRVLGAFVMIAVMSACNEAPNGPDVKAPGNTEIPEAAFSYTVEDYKAMFEKDMAGTPALAKRAKGISPVDLRTLHSLKQSVFNRYYVPNFNKIETEEQLQQAEKALGMNRKEIAKNADKIREKRVAGARYLLYQDVVAALKGKIAVKPLLKSAYVGGMSDDEFWLLAMMPYFIDGTVEAILDARAFEKEVMGSEGFANRSDCFRHMIWNHLLADYNSHEVNYKSEAAGWAKQFSDAHERGGTTSTSWYEYNYGQMAAELDHPMDYHNNQIGRDNFLKYSNNRGKLSWWGYDSRWIETMSIPLVKDNFRWLAQSIAVKFDATSQLPDLRYKPVFYLGN